MAGGIFLIQDDGGLVEMTEQAYDSEDLLQALVARYPRLLAGDQINPSAPRRWLLVKREIAVPSEQEGSDRWSLDHLFLDQEAVPTLVEIKRSSDTRIRREVVGQMLDYAANGVVYWPIEQIREGFEQECETQCVDPDEMVRALIGDEGDPEAFWGSVKTNLQAGRIRMMFVADRIPAELQRIVEFLNEQMDPAEVFAVEIKQFTGQNMQTLVPRVVGATAEAQKRKGATRQARQWDEALFFAELESHHSADAVRAVRILLDGVRQDGATIAWGRGAQYGTFNIKYPAGDSLVSVCGMGTNGKISIQFGYLKDHEPFTDRTLRLELLRRLNDIEGIALPDDKADLWPSIELRSIATGDAAQKLAAAMAWVFDQLRGGAPAGESNV